MLKSLKGNMPDITPAQVVAAFFASLLPVLTLAGVDLSLEQIDALSDLKLVALGLVGADAAIRVGRNLGGRPKARRSKPEDTGGSL